MSCFAPVLNLINRLLGVVKNSDMMRIRGTSSAPMQKRVASIEFVVGLLLKPHLQLVLRAYHFLSGQSGRFQPKCDFKPHLQWHTWGLMVKGYNLRPFANLPEQWRDY